MKGLIALGITTLALAPVGCGSSTKVDTAGIASAANQGMAKELGTPAVLAAGAAAVRREVKKELAGQSDPNLYSSRVTATCSPPRSLTSPTGHPQLRCVAVLRGRILGVDSPIDPRRQIDSEAWVVDITRSGKILGPGVLHGLGTKFGQDLQQDAAYGCLKAFFTHPDSIPAGCAG